MVQRGFCKSAILMALQGPFVVVADSQAPHVIEALRAAGAFPIVKASWADAPTAVGSVEPLAVVLAEPCSDHTKAEARALAAKLKDGSRPYTPVIAYLRDDGPVPIADALVMSASVPAERIARRLSAALRIRTLHGTVLRRGATLAGRGAQPPELPAGDPLAEATVLVAGRGHSYPVLSVALGEQVKLVGALSVESAANALNARHINGMVIGEGLGPRVVQALLNVVAEDLRSRDLPVAVLGGHGGPLEEFAAQLPNLERFADGPAQLVARFLPYVRKHAFGEGLKRMLKSLDAKGMLDASTGLHAHDAFWRDLNRAIDDAKKRRVGLSIARFSFDGIDRRTSLDCARLLSRLLRQLDFACREADNSIFAVFTETDLRAAHVIARRIASVLRNSMLAQDRERAVEAAVTLATLKPTDNVDSLIARVADEVAAG
jgi:GGDEF domain-containing protein